MSTGSFADGGPSEAANPGRPLIRPPRLGIMRP